MLDGVIDTSEVGIASASSMTFGPSSGVGLPSTTGKGLTSEIWSS